MSSPQPGPCLWCDSAAVYRIQRGLPAGNPTGSSAAASDPSVGPRRQWGCSNCGRTWSHLTLKIRRGEVVETERGPIKASAADVAWVRQVRAFLLEVFAQQRQVDAAELKEQVGLPHSLDEVGRLLELLNEDCARRGEPSLSALLVAGVPEPKAEPGGPSTEIISQAEINDLLNGAYGETDRRDAADPTPEPA